MLQEYSCLPFVSRRDVPPGLPFSAPSMRSLGPGRPDSRPRRPLLTCLEPRLSRKTASARALGTRITILNAVEGWRERVGGTQFDSSQCTRLVTLSKLEPSFQGRRPYFHTLRTEFTIHTSRSCSGNASGQRSACGPVMNCMRCPGAFHGHEGFNSSYGEPSVRTPLTAERHSSLSPCHHPVASQSSFDGIYVRSPVEFGYREYLSGPGVR